MVSGRRWRRKERKKISGYKGKEEVIIYRGRRRRDESGGAGSNSEIEEEVAGFEIEESDEKEAGFEIGGSGEKVRGCVEKEASGDLEIEGSDKAPSSVPSSHHLYNSLVREN